MRNLTQPHRLIHAVLAVVGLVPLLTGRSHH